jgi:uncharacterized membrane protein YgcG
LFAKSTQYRNKKKKKKMKPTLIFILLLVQISLLIFLSSISFFINAQQQQQQQDSTTRSFGGCDVATTLAINNDNGRTLATLPICFLSIGNWGTADPSTVGLVAQTIENIAWLGRFTVGEIAQREIEDNYNHGGGNDNNNNNSITTTTQPPTTTATPPPTSTTFQTTTSITLEPSNESSTTTSISTTELIITTSTVPPITTTTTTTTETPPTTTIPETTNTSQQNQTTRIRKISNDLCCRVANVFALGNNFDPLGVVSTSDSKWDTVYLNQFRNLTVSSSIAQQQLLDRFYNNPRNLTQEDDGPKYLTWEHLLESLDQNSDNATEIFNSLPAAKLSLGLFRNLSFIKNFDSSITAEDYNVTFFAALGNQDVGLNYSEALSRNKAPNNTRARAQINFGQQQTSSSQRYEQYWQMPNNQYYYDIDISITNYTNTFSSSSSGGSNTNGGGSASGSGDGSTSGSTTTLPPLTPPTQTTPSPGSPNGNFDEEAYYYVPAEYRYQYLRVIVIDTPSFKYNCPKDADEANSTSFPADKLKACNNQKAWIEKVLSDSDQNLTIAAVMVVGHASIAGPIVQEAFNYSGTRVSTTINPNPLIGTTDKTLDAYLVPLLRKHRVSLYLSAGGGLTSVTNPVAAIGIERNLTVSKYETGGLAYIQNGQAQLKYSVASNPNRTCDFPPFANFTANGILPATLNSAFSSIAQVSTAFGSSCVPEGFFFAHYIEYNDVKIEDKGDPRDSSSSTGQGFSSNNNNNKKRTLWRRVPTAFIHCAMNNTGIAVSCRSLTFRSHIELPVPEASQLLGLLWGVFFFVLVVVTIIVCYARRKGETKKKKEKEAVVDSEDDEKKKEKQEEDNKKEKAVDELKEPLLKEDEKSPQKKVQEEPPRVDVVKPTEKKPEEKPISVSSSTAAVTTKNNNNSKNPNDEANDGTEMKSQTVFSPKEKVDQGEEPLILPSSKKVTAAKTKTKTSSSIPEPIAQEMEEFTFAPVGDATSGFRQDQMLLEEQASADLHASKNSNGAVIVKKKPTKDDADI